MGGFVLEGRWIGSVSNEPPSLHDALASITLPQVPQRQIDCINRVVARA